MWYLHFDKRKIVLPLEICKCEQRKEKKKGSQGNREMKDVEENEELHEKPECLSNKGREDVNR